MSSARCLQCSSFAVYNQQVGNLFCSNTGCRFFDPEVVKFITNHNNDLTQWHGSQQRGFLNPQLQTQPQEIQKPTLNNHYLHQDHQTVQLGPTFQNGATAQNILDQQPNNQNQSILPNNGNFPQSMIPNQQAMTNTIQQQSSQSAMPNNNNSWQTTNTIQNQQSQPEDSQPNDVFINNSIGDEPHHYCTSCGTPLAEESANYCQACGKQVPRKTIGSNTNQQSFSGSSASGNTRKRTFKESKSGSFKSSFDDIQPIQQSSFDGGLEWAGDVSMPFATPPNSTSNSNPGNTSLNAVFGNIENHATSFSVVTQDYANLPEKSLRELLMEMQPSNNPDIPPTVENQDLHFPFNDEPNQINPDTNNTGTTANNISNLVVKHDDQHKNPFSSPDFEVDDLGNTPLHQLVREESFHEAMAILLKIPLAQRFRYINHRNHRGNVVLHTALHDFNKEIIVAIIKHGADVHIQDRNGNNIILQIINNPNFKEPIVLALIKVIFNELDDQGIQTLINDETKSFNADGYSVIHEVVRKNYMQVLKYLCESARLNLNAVDRREKQTALAMGCKKRNWPMAILLIEMGACVNIPTSSEWLPVHAALDDQNDEMLQKFVDNGVDIYGYQDCKNISMKKKCESYMRKRRRNTQTGDRGWKKRRRCRCGETNSSVRE